MSRKAKQPAKPKRQKKANDRSPVPKRLPFFVQARSDSEHQLDQQRA
jgi:hypothetical protein